MNSCSAVLPSLANDSQCQNKGVEVHLHTGRFLQCCNKEENRVFTMITQYLYKTLDVVTYFAVSKVLIGYHEIVT